VKTFEFSKLNSDFTEYVYFTWAFFFVVKEICGQNRWLIFKERIKKNPVGEVCLAHDSVNTTINLLLRKNKRGEFHDYAMGTESGRALAASGSFSSLIFVPLRSPQHQRWLSRDCHYQYSCQRSGFDMFVICNWVATQWQQHSTHLHTNST
jgi:hypothetical protein